MGLVWLTIVICVIFTFLKARVLMQIAAARRLGTYPKQGKATMADVERLLSSGNRHWAIRCYREINKVGIAEARSIVDKMDIKKISN
jgi:ribosomal protein L7/L12